MEIHWASIIEYCQQAASDGKLVTALFTEQRQKEAPSDYHGEFTVWPSKYDAFRHFAENPDAWDLVRKGYEWRSFGLYDKIETYRRKVERGDMRGNDARALMDSCFKELSLIGATALKERGNNSQQKADDVAARLARADVRIVEEKQQERKPGRTKGQSMIQQAVDSARKAKVQ